MGAPIDLPFNTSNPLSTTPVPATAEYGSTTPAQLPPGAALPTNAFGNVRPGMFQTFLNQTPLQVSPLGDTGSLGEKYDAGHYFSMGGHKAVTFNEDNVHAQCVTCNRYKHGNLLEYQIGIEKRIGPERLLELHEKAHETRKYTPDELKYIIHTYKEKIKFCKKNSLN